MIRSPYFSYSYRPCPVTHNGPSNESLQLAKACCSCLDLGDGLIALVLLVGSAFSYRYWDWLASSTESGSTTVRNIALIVAGLVALILALWRGAIGERQASAAEQAVLDGRLPAGDSRCLRATASRLVWEVSTRSGTWQRVKRRKGGRRHAYDCSA